MHILNPFVTDSCNGRLAMHFGVLKRIVDDWVERIKPQLSQFLDFDCGANSAVLVNNLDWTKDFDVLSFLRDIGKHFSINSMIQKESVRQRIEREGEGISFTEFTYMILQSYDFRESYGKMKYRDFL